MALSKEREGEIALAVLKHRMKKEGLHLGNLKRELGNVSTATGIPLNELQDLVRLLSEELFEEVFHGVFSSKGSDEKD